MATDASPDLRIKYDAAAAGWRDKMRALGYLDAYLGFLSESGVRAAPGTRVIDIGCGSAGMAEAWVSIQGPGHAVTLLDPSAGMLARGAAQLARRGVLASLRQGTLEEAGTAERYDVLLAAHVIEHGADPAAMLARMRALAAPGARLWLVVSKPHWCNAIVWLHWRHRSHPPARVRAMLAAAGWRLRAEYAFPAGPPSRTSRGYACSAD